jgi:hypothetical protein
MKALLAQWVTERQQALLEQVMLTWHEGMGRLSPDDALMERILATIPPPPEPPPVEEPAPVEAAPQAVTDPLLGQGLEAMEQAATQGEVLKQLLNALTHFAERSALFVVKQGIASLYAHRGFEAEAPRNGTPVVPPPELEALIQGRVPLIQAPGPAYAALLAPLSRFEATDLRLVPLSLRRKTVALLLVDSGLIEAIEHPHHVRALAYVAEARLSHLAGAKEEAKAAPVEPQPSVLTQLIADPIAESHGPSLDPKVRANAERSARVLVGDIELYFPGKVTQGQQQGNLYSAMRDELDRSRHSFVERYGAEVEAEHQIFYQTVVQQLCGGDASRLGPAPWATR